MFDSKGDRIPLREMYEEMSAVRRMLRSPAPEVPSSPPKPRCNPGGLAPEVDPLDRSETRSARLPEGLDTLLPGVDLLALIVGIDRSKVSGYDLVKVLQAESRLASHIQAGMNMTMAEIAGLTGTDSAETPASEIAASEIAAALCLTRQSSLIETELAVALVDNPRVLEALSVGAIDLRRARVIINGLATVDETTASDIIDRILPGAAEKTTGQIAAQIRRLVIAANPKQAEVTYQAALENRRLVIYDNPDGTATLIASNLPPDRLNAIRQRIEELSRTLKTPDDTRTADQLRADTFLDLLEDRVTGGQGRAFVNIDVDLTTLMGLDDNPAHIPGYGPILAELGRKTVLDQTDCKWEFTVTDQGRPVATGTLRRRPTTGMKRRIRSRYPTCAHPGCRRPARQSDIDHRIEWAKGGQTHLHNLAPLCEQHHQLKDHGWRYKPLPDGSFEFTSPLGHTYITCGQSP